MRLLNVMKENFIYLNYLFQGELLEFISEVSHHRKFSAPDFMDLVVEVIDQDGSNNRVLSMTHYFEQNGDLVPDPVMTFLVFDSGIIFALSYQDQFSYQEIYTKSGSVNMKLMKELNLFLNTWLTNIEQQGFKPIKGVNNND